MDKQRLLELARHSINRTAPTNFTANQVNAAFRDELKKWAGTPNQFMKNRYDIYDVLIKVIDEAMPKKVLNPLAKFVNVIQVDDGQKAVIRQTRGKNRGKKFITKAAVSGVYETFRLDQADFEIPVHAVGGGATIDFQRLLDGAETLADVMEVLRDGIYEAVQVEICHALAAAYSAGSFPAANKKTSNGFDATKMAQLLGVVRAYSDDVAIFGTPAFVAGMGADAIVPAIAQAAQGIYPLDDIDSIHKFGRPLIFRGAPLVELPQSFEDETNTTKVLDDQYAFVLPGGKEKIIHLALEGQTQITDYTNRDASLEIYAWKKLGTGLVTYNDWGIFQNTSLA